MHYIISDIHNDNERFEVLLERLQLQKEDKVYILGDLFDRTNYNPDPVGVYFNILKLGNQCQVIRGNHEQELAQYILTYFTTKERQRKKLKPYGYNTFEELSRRLTPVDLENMAKWMLNLPLQIEEMIDERSYLFAHAMTSKPNEIQEDEYYLQGGNDFEEFLKNGIDGYISVCGHSNPTGSQIWKNDIKNVILCDCGCGYRSGKLGCLCVETGEEIYV